ncbi:MAG: DinB family protein [Candidatus Acidiferrales bacterium]
MKKLLLSALTIALLSAAEPAVARAASHSAAAPAARRQAQAAAQSTDKTPPSYDMKPQSLLDLDAMHKKYVDLATAIPQEKYTWRPSDGARSFSEVFLHVAGSNYFFLQFLGTPLPANMEMKNFDKSTTDKSQIIDALNKSFDSAHATIEKMTNADFNKPLPKLGPQANDGDVIYLIVTDLHEHLGQSIAYARANGIVPPWTAAAQAAAAAKKAAGSKE